MTGINIPCYFFFNIKQTLPGWQREEKLLIYMPKVNGVRRAHSGGERFAFVFFSLKQQNIFVQIKS